MVRELAGLVPKQSHQSHRRAAASVQQNVSEERQRRDDLNSPDKRAGEPKFTTDQEVLANVDDHDIRSGHKHCGRSPRTVVEASWSEKHQPVVSTQDGQRQIDQPVAITPPLLGRGE